jgi:hypothetical protein
VRIRSLEHTVKLILLGFLTLLPVVFHALQRWNQAKAEFEKETRG